MFIELAGKRASLTGWASLQSHGFLDLNCTLISASLVFWNLFYLDVHFWIFFIIRKPVVVHSHFLNQYCVAWHSIFRKPAVYSLFQVNDIRCFKFNKSFVLFYFLTLGNSITWTQDRGDQGINFLQEDNNAMLVICTWCDLLLVCDVDTGFD